MKKNTTPTKRARLSKARTLAIDIGGTGLRASVLDENGNMIGEEVRIDTPYPCPPKVMLESLEKLVGPLPAYDRVSVGFPGVVGNGIGRLELKDSAWGWRAGVAYEIPEYAFRASLVYNSEVNLNDISGTLNLSQVNGRILNVYGAQKMPDSLELKVQSGIAPDWLAFGSVKWTDWSQLQTIPFCVVGVPVCNGATQITSLELGYRDGWTISGGVGHK